MTQDVKDSDKPHYLGHRQRLRERFLAAAAAESFDALSPYEYIELLLILAQPRGDVKPLAKALLQRFGTIGGVLSASPEQLRGVKGIGNAAVAALKSAQAAALYLLRDEVIEKPVLSSWDRLIDYCHAAMAHREVEQFRLLFLDRKNRLMAEELQQKGTIDHTPVYPREVVRRALELQASALILVHNHPSGDPQPSKADVEMTRRIGEACKAVGVILHDHIVIGRTGYCSFKADGLL